MPRQPYLYDGAGQNRTGRFPEPKFDPKAITRASWEPKDLKPQLTGPFVTFSRHPDARLVLSHRSNDYVSLSPKTKGWIKVVRIVQLCLRILQFVTAAGILALLVLLNYMEALVGWVMRITAGIAIIHCLYAMYHLSRPARGRSPASSTAYQLFAGLSDVGVVALFAYGALSPQKNSAAWSTRWIEQNLVSHFVLALHYTFTEASVLHVVSAAMSAWLGFMFRKIAQMPPDMNPLEDHLTSRAKYKMDRLSVAITPSKSSEERLSTSLEGPSASMIPHDDITGPPSAPFQRTRAGSNLSSGADDLYDEGSYRHHEITLASTTGKSAADRNSCSKPTSRWSCRGSYVEVPLDDHSSTQSPRTLAASAVPIASLSPDYPVGKFTETWYTSDSLISRTHKRKRTLNVVVAAEEKRCTARNSYEVVDQRYNQECSNSEHDEKHVAGVGYETHLGESPPLNLISPSVQFPSKPKTLFYTAGNATPSDTNRDPPVVSGNGNPENMLVSVGGQRWPRLRDSRIQPEADFCYSKPYGELRPATPPVLIGTNRHVSSGNDIENHQHSQAFERRNVSGQVVEEGLAGPKGRFSR